MTSPWRGPIPWLVTLVAVAQFSCAFGGRLTPWKGGGFGMFATVDSPSGRFLSVVVVDESGERLRVSTPPNRWTETTALSPSRIGKVTAFPTDSRLRAVAAAIAQADFALAPAADTQLPPRLLRSRYASALAAIHGKVRSAVVVGPIRTAASALRVREVRVGVVGIEIDMPTDSVRLRDVASVTITSAGPFADGPR